MSISVPTVRVADALAVRGASVVCTDGTTHWVPTAPFDFTIIAESGAECTVQLRLRHDGPFRAATSTSPRLPALLPPEQQREQPKTQANGAVTDRFDTAEHPLLLTSEETTEAQPPRPTSPSPARTPTAEAKREHRALQQQQLTATAPCQVVGNCVRSSGYPSTNYDNYETCTISGFPPSPILVTAFAVERGGTQ
eukprot:1788961-Prymnesium_polylepis.1